MWGSSQRDEAIQISQTNIYVTKTLLNALQYLRLPGDERYLWIDQICIDQNDTEERGSQVRLMRYIYSEASRVVAWLGADQREVEELFRMIPFKNDKEAFNFLENNERGQYM